MGLINRISGKKTKSDRSDFFKLESQKLIQTKKPSGEEIQRILDKPWSEVSKEDRKILCTQDLGINISCNRCNSKNEYLDKSPRKSKSEVPEEMIQITKTWVIPPDGCPIEAHKFLDGQTVDVQEMFEIPFGKYQGFQSDCPGMFGFEELDEKCNCWLIGGVFDKIILEKRKHEMQNYVKRLGTDFQNLNLDVSIISKNKVSVVEPIPELQLSFETPNEINGKPVQSSERKRLSKSKMKSQQKMDEKKAEEDFNKLCDWIPKYLAAIEILDEDQKVERIRVLRRERDFVYNRFKKLGRFDGYEISMMKTLENLDRFFDTAILHDLTNLSERSKIIISKTEQRH